MHMAAGACYRAIALADLCRIVAGFRLRPKFLLQFIPCLFFWKLEVDFGGILALLLLRGIFAALLLGIKRSTSSLSC